MTKRVRLSAETRKAQILRAAAQLLAQHGYQSLTIAAVAEACGLTRAGVLHHVASKEDLLIEVLRDRERQASTHLAGALDTPEQRGAREVFDTLMRRHLSDPDLVRLFSRLSTEAIDEEHPAHDYFVERLHRGARQLGRLLTDRSDDPVSLALEILVFMDGLELNWIRDPGLPIWEHWCHFADRNIGPSPAGGESHGQGSTSRDSNDPLGDAMSSS